MSENIHPAKNKVPSSPMKEAEPEDHMLLSSPHFRPAGDQNLTMDLKKQQCLSSSQQYPSQIPGRKSLGRRVSFAATAHVRLYDKADSDREEEKGSEEEDLDFRPSPKKGSSLKGSPKPPSVQSPSGPTRPSRLSESFTPGEDSAPSTPISLNRFSTVTNYSTLNEPAGGRSSPNSIGSFDIDIKDVNSSSFTSYHSGGEEDETIELSQIGPRTDNDVDMEFTSCVGGILAKSDATTLAKQPEEDNTMDFTVCVGGIIRRLPGIRLSDASCASSVDTMELTECVGKIIARQQGLPDDKVEESGDDMDMTMVVDRTIHCREEMGSPSPFLVSTPVKPSNGTLAANAVAAGITFIGDVGEPDAFKLLACESPMPANVESMDQRIFHTFIDTDKCSDAPTPINNRIQPSQLNGLSHDNQFTQSYDTLPSTLASAGQSLKASLSVMNTPKRPTAASLLAQSSFASSALSLPSQHEPATASFTDFLNETGIRFLENISSLKRRETTGRPRDSDVVAPSKQAFIASALLPQLDFFENVQSSYHHILYPSIGSRRFGPRDYGSQGGPGSAGEPVWYPAPIGLPPVPTR